MPTGPASRTVDPAGRVELAGAYAHADLPALLAGIDVAVVPSAVWEGAPLTVGEARAARLPVIASRMGGLAEGVRDGVDGLLVEGWSDDALAAAIQRLADRPYLVDAMAAAIGAPRTFADYVDDLEAAYAAGAAPHIEPRDAARGALAGRLRRDLEPGPDQRRGRARRLGDGFTVEHRRATTARRATSAPPRPAAVEVRHQWPPLFDDPGLGRLVLIQPWEFGSIPRDWLEPLQPASTRCGCRARSCATCTSATASRPTACTSCRTASTSTCTARTARARRLAGDDVCAFLFVGGTIYRKGIDVLLAAFDEAFAGRDDVLLVIKDVGAGTFYSGMNVADELRAPARPPARRSRCYRRRPRRRAGSRRCTAPATCSCTRTAARASRCPCSRRWPAACRCS